MRRTACGGSGGRTLRETESPGDRAPRGGAGGVPCLSCGRCLLPHRPDRLGIGHPRSYDARTFHGRPHSRKDGSRSPLAGDGAIPQGLWPGRSPDTGLVSGRSTRPRQRVGGTAVMPPRTARQAPRGSPSSSGTARTGPPRPAGAVGRGRLRSVRAYTRPPTHCSPGAGLTRSRAWAGSTGPSPRSAVP
jgi:hypothetical protein